MNGIEPRTLPSLLSFIVDNRGRSCPTAPEGFPLIATNCIKDDSIYPVFENVRHISSETYRDWFRSHPEPGDIIFVCKGSPGRIAMVPDPVPFCIAQDMVALRADSHIMNPRYLYYALRNPDVRARIENMHVGTMIPHFKKGDFGKLSLDVHVRLSDQVAIAEILGALDDKIAANNTCLESIDALTSALLEERLAVSAGWSNLGSIADVNVSSVKPAQGGQLRYIDIASVGVGLFDFPELMNWDSAPSRARRAVQKGDTIWSTVRPNRRSHALVLSEDQSLVASTGLAVLTPKRGNFAFLYEVTRLPGFTSFLEAAADGSAYPAVRAERFADAPVPALSLDAQADFEQLAAPMRQHAHALQEENRTLAELRDTLLPQLMSGKFRVKEAEQQVEAVV